MKPKRNLPTLRMAALTTGLGLLFGSACHADLAPELPPPAGKPGITYEQDIKPLFARSCTKCHGEEKQKAKLRLDSRQAVLDGAGDEKVIRRGDSAGSKLVRVVSKATEAEDEWMPPPGKAKELTAEEIGLVRAWIDQGAK